MPAVVLDDARIITFMQPGSRSERGRSRVELAKQISDMGPVSARRYAE